MMNFIQMILPSLIVGGILLLAVILIVKKIVRDKKNHVCSCAGGCSACSQNCSYREKEVKKEPNKK